MNTQRDMSGYHDCPCRDCFEIAIGVDDDGAPSLCHDCKGAGCYKEGDPAAYGPGLPAHARECQAPDAYEGGSYPPNDEGGDHV